MRTTRILSTLALAALLAAPGLAQRETPTRRGEILQRLDKNQDGRLDEAERGAAREEFRRRVETRRDRAGEAAPRGPGLRGPGLRGQDSDDSGRLPRQGGADRGRPTHPERAGRPARRGAPRGLGPLGRSLEKRFGNGDGRVGPMERMRLRRLAERWRGARGGEAQRPERERMRGRGEGRRGGRGERSRGRRPDAGTGSRAEDF